ncbi:MAG: thiamine phosphate synthase [Pseudomonadota bacterium]
MMRLKHQAKTARKWRVASRQIARHFPTGLPRLLLLTDPERVPDPIAVVRGLPRGSGVIYRHFGRDDRVQLAARLSRLCRQKRFVFLIAADPVLAMRVGANGVHWPEMHAHQARKWRKRFKLQTASAHSRRAVRQNDCFKVNTVLLSTVFVSNSSSAGAPIGAVRYRQLARSSPIPLYALGGVNAENAQRVADVSGLAAIEGFVSAAD